MREGLGHQSQNRQNRPLRTETSPVLPIPLLKRMSALVGVRESSRRAGKVSFSAPEA
jgi:hypothetical protein